MKVISYIAAFTFIITLSLSACTENNKESCEQQDMNEILNCGVEKNVEVCCETGASCVYKYNGNEFPDTEAGLSALSDSLDCSYKSAEVGDSQKQLIIKSLIELKDKALLGNFE